MDNPNFIVSTAPPGDSTNKSASTEFVTLAIASATASLPAGVSSTQVDFISGGIQVPSTTFPYVLLLNCPFTSTITTFWAYNYTGSASIKLAIGTTDITGGSLSVSTSAIASATITTTNIISPQGQLFLYVTSATGSQALSFTVIYSKQLATA